MEEPEGRAIERGAPTKVRVRGQATVIGRVRSDGVPAALQSTTKLDYHRIHQTRL